MKEIVLNHLLKYGSITSLTAIKKYGITRLSAWIFWLRKDGYRISSKKIAVKNRYGKTVYVSEYRLLEAIDGI